MQSVLAARRSPRHIRSGCFCFTVFWTGSRLWRSQKLFRYSEFTLHISFVAAQACPGSHLWTTGPLSLIEHLGFRLRDAIHEQWMRLVVQLRSPVHVLDGYLEVASSLAVSFRTDDLFFVGSKSSLCLRH